MSHHAGRGGRPEAMAMPEGKNRTMAIRDALADVDDMDKPAIYNKLEYTTLKRWRGSYKWLRIKRLYNSLLLWGRGQDYRNLGGLPPRNL